MHALPIMYPLMCAAAFLDIADSAQARPPLVQKRRAAIEASSALHVRKSGAKKTPIEQLKGRDHKNDPYCADIVWVLFDTGSSPFWIPGHAWQCIDNIDSNITHIAQDECGKAHLTTRADFEFSGGGIADTPHAWFNSSYGEGDHGALGPVGHQEITIGDLHLPDAVTGIGTEIDWPYDPLIGLLGFAFPYRTSYWPRAELDQVVEVQYLANITHYNPVVFQAAADGYISPIFGYYFDGFGNKDGSVGGKIVFGGEPSIPAGPFTPGIPIVPKAQNRADSSDEIVHDFWTFHMDGFKIVPAPGADPIVFSYLNDDAGEMRDIKSMYYNHSAVLDTGTPPCFLPGDVVNETLKHIHPAPFLDDVGHYYAVCNATLPALAITVGGIDLWFNRSGIVFPESIESEKGACQVGIRPADPYQPLIGLGWLINVVSVHEFGDAMAPTVNFAQRLWE
ncbi:unnamed protein product [Zymoseptoria tritici ST99CH_1A5]|uniref:Peptidase A1 domain-containing protein n=1 Tax=Zymoseptoria tritici ST99CH_1A5 TaxID=1276529 RepID=A0A1Y6L522_ZYMTR|nr:unnamed protein product [Zymoseptoria tritici ST99CH_1A5]